MKHRKRVEKLGRTSSHRRCMIANMLKSLIENGKISTTEPKAKSLRRYADRMVTLAKKNTLASRRQAIAEMMVSYNKLTPKEARDAKAGDTSAYNTDRKVIGKLFDEIGPRFVNRAGGYTRITKTSKRRIGDDTALCVIEFLAE